MRKRQSVDAGVTLLEILVVLTIISLVAGALVVSMPPQTQQVEVEAAKLEETFETMADRAVYTGQPHRLEMNLRTYSASILSGGEWVPLASPNHRIPRRMNFRPVAGFTANDDGEWRIVFDPTGILPQGVIRLRSEGTDIEIPVVPEARQLNATGVR